jgi:GNAT superfamily N-acetyltransferase
VVLTQGRPILPLATAPDGARLAEIYLAAVRQAMPWLNLAHSDQEIRPWLPQGMLPQHEVWVVERADGVRGFIALSRERSWVDHLYLEPEAQGRGHGGALLELAKERSAGCRQLWAFQRNTWAQAFYERRGFRQLEFGDGATNEEREPAVLYRWDGPD